MFQFQYSVSHNGKFLFRTDWLESIDAQRVARHLLMVFYADVYMIIENRRHCVVTQTILI